MAAVADHTAIERMDKSSIAISDCGARHNRLHTP
jgi:hypothetical protein